MAELTRQAFRAAYIGQQSTLQLTCAVVQNLVRRVILGHRSAFTAAEARSLHRRYIDLLRTDFAHAEAGEYPRSLLFGMPVREYARALPRLVLDLPRVVLRMKRGDWRDLPSGVDLDSFPPYYRRTFHWQSDGYLSRRSAELYDLAVEVLFGGAGDVMRRQVLPPLVHFARGRGTPLRVLDVACGTGRTLAQLARTLPDAAVTGLDLSPWYLDVARGRLPPGASLVAGNAEDMPFDDGSFDAVLSVYLFHELPRNARRRVMAEMRRVLRPGGLLVIADSVQRSDAADIAAFLERFQAELHEPFYRDYIGDDLATALAESGLEPVGEDDAFLTKIVTARRPAPDRAPR